MTATSQMWEQKGSVWFVAKVESLLDLAWQHNLVASNCVKLLWWCKSESYSDQYICKVQDHTQGCLSAIQKQTSTLSFNNFEWYCPKKSTSFH